MEAEAHTGDEADLGVHRLDEGVGEAVGQRRGDARAVPGDRPRERDEGRIHLMLRPALLPPGIEGRPQITTDGLPQYVKAIARSFRWDVDFAQLLRVGEAPNLVALDRAAGQAAQGAVLVLVRRRDRGRPRAASGCPWAAPVIRHVARMLFPSTKGPGRWWPARRCSACSSVLWYSYTVKHVKRAKVSSPSKEAPEGREGDGRDCG